MKRGRDREVIEYFILSEDKIPLFKSSIKLPPSEVLVASACWTSVIKIHCGKDVLDLFALKLLVFNVLLVWQFCKLDQVHSRSLRVLDSQITT